MGNFISNQRKEHTDGGILASFSEEDEAAFEKFVRNTNELLEESKSSVNE